MIHQYIMDIAAAGNQRTDEWHRERLGKFTSSEIFSLIGEGRKNLLTEKAQTYIDKKASEILTGAFDHAFSNAIAWGQENEQYAKDELRGMGIIVIESGFITSLDYDNYGGSPDGIIDSNTILEIKCPFNSANHVDVFKNGAEAIKDEYYYQMQSNMLITGAEKCLFVSFDPRFLKSKHWIKIVEIDKDEMAQERIIKKLAEANKYLSELLSCFEN